MEAGGYKGELLMVDRRTLRTFMFKKKNVEICFHLKYQLERPFLRKIPEFCTCCLLSPLSPNSDFSRRHTGRKLRSESPARNL